MENNQEVVTLPDRPLARVDELPAQASLTQVLIAALIDPRVEPAKLREILSIKRDIEKDEAERIYNECFALMQDELPVIAKDAQIEVKGQVRSKYARYETIAKAVRPILRKYGFSTRFNSHIEGKTVKVIGTIKHDAGHFEITEITLPLDESEFRNVVQNYGATMTFCRRYALCFALDIIVEGQDKDATFYSLVNEDQRKAIQSLIDICKLTPESTSKFLSLVGAKSVADKRGVVCDDNSLGRDRGRGHQKNVRYNPETAAIASCRADSGTSRPQLPNRTARAAATAQGEVWRPAPNAMPRSKSTNSTSTRAIS